MMELPPLYAQVHPGLESVAADEITRDLGGEVRKSGRGIVAFRLNHLDRKVLTLRTTEDIFLLAWGTDTLTYRAGDLKTIRQWTAKVKWDRLFKLHHDLRPPRGKPTFHLVCQMQGEHGYRRIDAQEAFARGLQGSIPPGWKPAEENAWLELWLTIRGAQAVCGVRLSDRTMRHRTWKESHIAASLRPTVAAAMARLAGIGPGLTLLDPFCGAGTILAEEHDLIGRRRLADVRILGADLDMHALHCAQDNVRKCGGVRLLRADARALPLADQVIDRLVTNPPFGKQLASPETVGPLYRAAACEWARVLRPGGRAVVLVADAAALDQALQPFHWRRLQQLRLRVLGQPAVLSVWQVPAHS